MAKKTEKELLQLVETQIANKNAYNKAKAKELESREALLSILPESGSKKTMMVGKYKITLSPKVNVSLDKDEITKTKIIDDVDWSELDDESLSLLSSETKFDSTGYKKLVKDNPDTFYDIMDYVTESIGQGTVTIKFPKE